MSWYAIFERYGARPGPPSGGGWKRGLVGLLLAFLVVLLLGGVLTGGGETWDLAYRLPLSHLSGSQLRAMAEAGEERFWSEGGLAAREGVLHLVQLLEVQRYLLLKGDLSPEAYRDLLRIFLDAEVGRHLPGEAVFGRQLGRFVRRLDNLGQLEVGVDLGAPFLEEGGVIWRVPVVRRFSDARRQYLVYRLRWEAGRPVLLPRSRWPVSPFRLKPRPGGVGER